MDEGGYLYLRIMSIIFLSSLQGHFLPFVEWIKLIPFLFPKHKKLKRQNNPTILGLTAASKAFILTIDFRIDCVLQCGSGKLEQY